MINNDMALYEFEALDGELDEYGQQTKKSRLLDDKKINKNEKLYKKYNSNSEIPIWSLIIKMSFGDLILILNKVNENIFFQIMKNSKICNWDNLNSKKRLFWYLK